MLNGRAINITGDFLVTFPIIEGSLVPFVDHNCNLATQRIPQSGELAQVRTQDDDVALCRVAALSKRRVSTRNLEISYLSSGRLPEEIEHEVSDHLDLEFRMYQ